MKSNFSKIDENIADAPYRVNRKAPWRLLMGQGGGYFTTSTIRAIYGSVSFEEASNLHAGLCRAKSGRRGGSGARCSAAPPLTMALSQLVLKKWGNF